LCSGAVVLFWLLVCTRRGGAVTVGETAGLSAKGQPIGVDVGLPRLVLCGGQLALPSRNGTRFHRIVSRELQHSLDRLSLSAPSGHAGARNRDRTRPRFLQDRSDRRRCGDRRSPADAAISVGRRTILRKRLEPEVELVELKEKTTLSREEAAARLHAIADELASNNDVVIEREHIRFVAHVPDQVNLKVEFEIEDDGTELEIELTW
jgi:amphi-Trp domain-containing protein